MQNVSATDRLLGRSTAGAGNVEEITCTAAARALLDDTTAAAMLATIGAAPTAAPTFTGLITTAGQIAFPATQNASANANTLDDYEEGAWTPALDFGGVTTGITYSVQSGSYTKVGRLVFVAMQITLSSKGAAVGNAGLSGLPFAVQQNSSTLYAGFYTGTTSTSGAIVANFDTGSTVGILLQGSVTGSTFLSNANFSNSTLLRMQGVYQTS